MEEERPILPHGVWHARQTARLAEQGIVPPPPVEASGTLAHDPILRLGDDVSEHTDSAAGPPSRTRAGGPMRRSDARSRVRDVERTRPPSAESAGSELALPDVRVNPAPEEFDYITLHEAARDAREKQMEAMERLDRREREARTSVIARRMRCVLCSFGYRLVDASSIGTKLFAELNRLVAKKYQDNDIMELINMAERFYHEQLVPVFADAQPPVVLPAFDRWAMFEHLTTLYHSLHPAIFLRSRVLALEDDLHVLGAHATTKDGRDNLKVIELRGKTIERQLKLMMTPPSKLAFGQGAAEELDPDVVAHFSNATAKRRDATEYMPSTLQWLRDSQVYDSTPLEGEEAQEEEGEERAEENGEIPVANLVRGRDRPAATTTTTTTARTATTPRLRHYAPERDGHAPRDTWRIDASESAPSSPSHSSSPGGGENL